MSGLFGVKAKGATIPRLTGVQLQTSSSAVPIPIGWGRNRVSMNVVYTTDFVGTAVYQKKAGKGGGGKTLSGYNYSAAFIFGLCEGPITGLAQVWNGKALTTTAVLGLSLFAGTTPQTPWSYVTTAHPSDARPYGGLAYLATSSFDLGSSASLPSLGFEIDFPLNATSTGVNAYDADPALVIQDFLTNTQYGVRFGAIDTTTLLGASGGASLQAYCKAAGLAFSPVLTNFETAAAILSRWLQLVNCGAVWSSGLLKFIPYGDTPLTNGAATFTPNVTPSFALTDDDFVADPNTDAIEVSRPIDMSQRFPVLPIEILNRNKEYSADVITVFDQNSIELYGRRESQNITAHEITTTAIAQVAGQLILQRALYNNQRYVFKLDWSYCLLEAMDLVTLTSGWLVARPVRIISIEENDIGVLTVTAEEFPAGLGNAPNYSVQASTGTVINQNVTPASVNPPVIFEPPAALTGNVAQAWFLVSGGTAGVADPNWGGCIINLSVDGGTTYAAIGQINGRAGQGVLTAALAAYGGANPDVTNTLAVNMASSADALPVATASDATNYTTLSLLDGEVLAYGSAVLTAANNYNVTNIQRGLYGTSPAAHAIGGQLSRLDGRQFKFDLPSNYIGLPLKFKFQSFNIFNRAVQDISTCTVYSHTPVAVPGTIAALPATGQVTVIDNTLVARTQGLSVRTQIFNTPGSATFTKQSSDKRYHVYGCGGGGGGGGGYQTSSNGSNGDQANSGGAGGGGGAGWGDFYIEASDIGATVSLTIGAGGTGGAAAASNDTSGGTGGAGGQTSFGTQNIWGGGGGGASTTNTGSFKTSAGGGGGTPSGGSPAGTFSGGSAAIAPGFDSLAGSGGTFGQAGMGSSGSAVGVPNITYGAGGGGAYGGTGGIGNAGASALYGPGGGGAGGSCYQNIGRAGGGGGASARNSNAAAAGGTSVAPNGGTPAAPSPVYWPGNGGGGGYAPAVGGGTAGAGGAGVNGSGGGGGGNSLNSQAAGAGGAGGGGFIVIIAYF